MFNFGSMHGKAAYLFPTGQRVSVKIGDIQVQGEVISHNGRHHVEVRLDTPVVVKTVVIIRRIFLQDLMEISYNSFHQESFFEGDVGVIGEDGKIRFLKDLPLPFNEKE